MKGYMNQQTIKSTAKEMDLQRIFKLDFSIMNIEKIEELNLVPKLRCLILNYNRITVIENLKTVPDLRELHIESNLLRRIAGLENCKNLTVLNLSGNKIEKIQGIGSQAKLQTLNLSNNRLTRMGNIDALRDLKHLNLSHNEIEVVQFIPAFSKLETVNLSHNKIKAILPDFFDNSPKLLHLNLSHNLIRHTQFIAPLLNLETLILTNNQISVFTPQSIHEYLQELDLSSNEITELVYFPQKFPDLMSLRLANNFITNEVTLLQSIAGAESLVQLDFRGNPMFSEGFEETVRKVLKLEVVNGKVVGEPGSKYKQGIDSIIREFREFPELYMKDDPEETAIKNSGFYSEQLELEMTGIKPNRPPSPQHRMKHSEQEFFQSCKALKQDIERNCKRSRQIKTHCLEIWKRNGYVPSSQPEIAAESVPTADVLGVESQKKLEEIRIENQRKLEKWRELKAKEKTFTIRQLSKRKKSQAQQKIVDNIVNGVIQPSSMPKFNRKSDRVDLLKTQMTAFDHKLINEAALARTQHRNFRPQSLKK